MVASYPQVMQQLLQGNSEKARYSQVTVIHSHGLKQDMTTRVVSASDPFYWGCQLKGSSVPSESCIFAVPSPVTEQGGP